jgi:F0F1-type ATP synthase membrane subunit b/b'
MEINVTCLILMLMFLGLFTFLSQTLFYYLNNVFSERERLIVGEKDILDNINNEINKQNIYIKERTELKFKELEIIYKKFRNEMSITQNNKIRLVKEASQKKYQETLLRIENESNIVNEELNDKKQELVTMVYQKLNEF